MEIKLKFPFTTQTGQKIEIVTTRRLKVRDIKAISDQANGNPAQMELLGVARMASLVPEDLDEMDAADYQVLKGRFLDVLGITGNAVDGGVAAGAVVPVPTE
ncbi:phage tail assembly protein [Verminephrobacter aporrectodeae subsp. tuberculatae]|uniref:phage tail assembly protein n=1 Tax=Verminephrobacter aporrectodeae TaxID=1110389 RepID=UPI0022376FE4|nr:phage tail assembly protein [Verminephrobacter aporrectodeae]MCW5223522.1 phage tail assembly protein [Verminephrobacter aporrectodeae subsp. tuberculatae]MCW5288987.1 phage tail assembly protein [Verminephrobacter aporrectodeae subsp. tuberculatae]